MQQQTPARMGRPPLPAKERKSALYAFRLDARGERTLSAVKRALKTDDTSETMRCALDALARELGVLS